jgi:hypothetical protein
VTTLVTENRPIDDAEVSAAQRLWRAVREAAASASADRPEQRWRDPEGRRIFDELFPQHDDVDRRFLETLRLEAAMFSGWSLRNLHGESLPSWNDKFAEAFSPAPPDADWSVPAFLDMTAALPDDYVVRAPRIAGERGYAVRGHLVNRDVAATQERIRILHRLGALDRLRRLAAPVLLEIGAGYGSLACHLLQCIPGAAYVVVDIEPSLRFSGSYLLLALGAERVRVIGAPDALQPGGVTLVPAQALAGLGAVAIDHATNTMSFSEMPATTVEHYGEWIRDHLAGDGVLFEQNFGPSEYETKSTFCVPDKVLGRVFPWSRVLRERELWGRSKVWAAKRPSWIAPSSG